MLHKANLHARGLAVLLSVFSIAETCGAVQETLPLLKCESLTRQRANFPLSTYELVDRGFKSYRLTIVDNQIVGHPIQRVLDGKNFDVSVEEGITKYVLYPVGKIVRSEHSGPPVAEDDSDIRTIQINPDRTALFIQADSEPIQITCGF